MAEYDAVSHAIHDDATAAVLRRYGMAAVARLYHADRARYSELPERGRKRLFCASGSK